MQTATTQTTTTTLTAALFNSRCYDVFDAREGDEFLNISAVNPAFVLILMLEKIKDTTIRTTYAADMSDRPQALAYLLGLRDDFND